ncbi:MAG: CDP-alcohol phosphatidyltransferase family protein [Propionibacteriaceae bacterium]|nr:CDP-alcohol phosphatidyltransferase family protein [Propionibacteriaceae bacterium]
MGRLLAAGAYRLNMTPNQVTGVSAVFTYSGIVVVALAPIAVWTGILVAALLVLGYALDSADGQLARLRGGGSLAGEWLDHVIDSGKIATLHVAVLVAFYRAGVEPIWLAVPLVFMVFYVIHFFGMLLTELLTRVHIARQGLPATPGSASQLMSILKLPTDYGLLCLVFVFWGIDPVFRWIYLLLALAMAGYTLLVLVKWYRQVARLQG